MEIWPGRPNLGKLEQKYEAVDMMTYVCFSLLAAVSVFTAC
jgi:hypothetical protein